MRSGGLRGYLGIGLLLGACSSAGTAASSGSTTAGGAGTGTSTGAEGSTGGRGTGSSASGSGASGTSGGNSSTGGWTFAGSECPLFAPGYAYNQDVSGDAPDPNSASHIESLASLAPNIAAEFPGGEFYNVVPPSQPPVSFGTAAALGFFPDGGFYFDTGAALAAATAPIPGGVVYENQGGNPGADHHLMVLQEGSCQLYEAYASNPTSSTSGWGILVQWDLAGSPQIPDPLDEGSTTQAGTPLLPGIIWPAEVRSGVIHHALDIVLADHAIMPCAYVHPASTVRWSDFAPAGEGLPYGARLRLKASYDSSGYTGTQALVVIAALKKYGLIATDASGETRSVFRLGEDPDGGTLDQADISQLDQLAWSDFDVMPLGTILTDQGCTP